LVVVILRLLNAWALWLCYDCFATSNDDPTNEYQPNESSTNRPNIIIGIGHFLDEFMLASPFLLVLGLSMRPSFNLPSQQQPAQSSLTNELVKESCIELGLVRELCLPQRMNVKLETCQQARMHTKRAGLRARCQRVEPSHHPPPAIRLDSREADCTLPQEPHPLLALLLTVDHGLQWTMHVCPQVKAKFPDFGSNEAMDQVLNLRPKRTKSNPPTVPTAQRLI
jgi:hypothetical protein